MTRRSLLVVAGIEAAAGAFVACALVALTVGAWRLGVGSRLVVQLPVLAGVGLVVGAGAQLGRRWRSTVELVSAWHRSARDRIEARWPAS